MNLQNLNQLDRPKAEMPWRPQADAPKSLHAH
jgi:hypothetical protein